MLDSPELVIFDLDNTLYDYEIPNQSAESALAKHLSIELKKNYDDISSELIESRTKVKERLGDTAASHSRLIYLREYLTTNRIPTRSSFALECEQVFWRAYLEKTRLFPGVEELISFFRLNKTTLVLVTDLCTSIQLRKLAWLDLEKSFDLIITSEEAGGDKKTGEPELMLRTLTEPIAGKTWSIGDKEWDHIFPSESTFFKKVESGLLKETCKGRYEFSSFPELLNFARLVL
jgi:putative hydrolase of the HAD superfamily